MSGDLISRAKLRRNLMIWADKLRTAGECGGCEVELLRAVVKMVDAQAAVDAAIPQHGSWKNGCECSVCGMAYGPKNAACAQGYHYCTYCGAKMDEDVVVNNNATAGKERR